jgi:hypothetical protein
MAVWYRVFGANETAPAPADIERCLATGGLAVSSRFQGDEQGWFRAELSVGPDLPPVAVERWLAGEEGIRAELNSWAGFLETCEHSPHHAALMERVIQARQLFTIAEPTHPRWAGGMCLALCQHLARVTDGVYQVDGAGFFAADGTVLVEAAT